MRKRDLTERQRDVLGFIKDYIAGSGYPPSLRDICARFGIKGPKNAAKHLEALEKKGFIKRPSNVSRGIEVVDAALRNAVSVPIAGRVRAGTPHLAVEDIVGHMALDSRFFKCSSETFVLKVEGESMRGAGIDDGDYIVVRPQETASNGDIVVALIDDEATVKRFFMEGGAVILKPENPSMAPVRIEGGERDVSIAGRVVSVVKRIE